MKNSNYRMLLFAFLVAGMICGAYVHNLIMLICFGVFALVWGIFISVSAVLDSDNVALKEYQEFRKTCGYVPGCYDFPYYIVQLSNRRLMSLYRGLKLMRKKNSQDSSLNEEGYEQRLNAELDNLLELTKNEIVYRVDHDDF